MFVNYEWPQCRRVPRVPVKRLFDLNLLSAGRYRQIVMMMMMMMPAAAAADDDDDDDDENLTIMLIFDYTCDKTFKALINFILFHSYVF